ncbi:MAG: phosphopantothenoylcysteine decarboxylase [Lentisphaerota bacterium]
MTAGPTREAIDPVRYISNRSSGKMGYAVAAAGVEQNHEVTLISGPVALSAPAGARLVNVTSAAEMAAAVMEHFTGCDVLVMAAAVADWRPVHPGTQKIKKSDQRMTLELEPTEDILLKILPMKSAQLVIGFAAETQNLLEEARRKLVRKELDLMVANDVSRTDAGFEVDMNEVVFIERDGETRQLPFMPKVEVARHLVKWVEDRIVKKSKKII